MFTEGRLSISQAGHPTVHAVEDHGNKNGNRRHVKAPVHGLHDRIEAGKQVGGGECVGQRVDTAPPMRFVREIWHAVYSLFSIVTLSGNSANTVLVACTLSPMATRGRAPRGRYPSTRYPKRKRGREAGRAGGSTY